MNDKWMTDIKRKADSFERKAPDDMLENIRQEMARRGLTMTPPAPVATTRRLFWQRWAVAASMAALVGGTAVYVVWHPSTNGPMLSQQQPTARNAVSSRQQQSSIGASNTEFAPKSPASRLVATASGSSLPANGGTYLPSGKYDTAVLGDATKKETLQTHDDVKSQTDGMLMAENQSATTTEKGAQHEVTKQQTSNSAAHEKQTSRNTSPDWDYNDGNLLALSTTTSPQSIHISAYYQGIGDFQKNSPGNGGPMVLSEPLDAGMPVLGAMPLMLNAVTSSTPIHSEKHHHMPIRGGVSLSIPVNKHWSVTTGVSYSTMSSDFEDLYANYNENSTQRLHYIGIPLSINYNVWQQNKVKVYASAGGEVEKLVYGRKKTHYTDPIISKTTTTTVTEHRPVFSTHVNAGISYSLLPSISLFAEPGLSYYFKNGSSVRSAYTDKQLLLNVNVGVRFGK